MTTSKTATTTKTVSSFNVKALTAACATAAKSFVKAEQTKGAALDKLADSFRTNGVTAESLKGNAKTSVPRGIIKAFFDELVSKSIIGKASAATYQTCFWIAFEKQVPFSTDLANQKSAENKKANVGKGAAKDATAKVKGSIVVTASRDNLQSLLMQTIKMARDLGLGTFASELTASGKGIDLLPKDFK